MTRAPDHASLARGLASVLSGQSGGRQQLAVLERTPNPYRPASAEIVTCRIGDRPALRLLCKYGPTRPADHPDEHRGGIAYEAYVYREVLEPHGVARPRCYGCYEEPGSGQSWLVLEYLDDTLRVSQAPSACALVSAAEWIGRFHAATEPQVHDDASHLWRYGPDHYLGWARRAVDFLRNGPKTLLWVAELAQDAQSFAAPLLDAPSAVIHSEYYPQNVLVQHEQIVPVDWETATVAAGELDLASLTEGWPSDVAERCEDAYRRCRWPSGAPHDFELALAAARVYWQLRWLGGRPSHFEPEGLGWRFSGLRDAAERMGIA